MKKITLIIFVLLISGCATQYYPLKKDSFFNSYQNNRTVMLMPYRVNAYTFISKFQTREHLDKKEKNAEDYFLTAYKSVLPSHGYRLVKYISREDLEKKDFDQDLYNIIDELYQEFNSAEYSLNRNLKEEKGKPFEYSVGIRVEELREKLGVNFDLILFITPSGYIESLGAFNAAEATANAIFSLGLSLLIPTPNDVVLLKTVLIDAKTGDIVWYDIESYYSMSLLSGGNIKDIVEKSISKMNNNKS